MNSNITDPTRLAVIDAMNLSPEDTRAEPVGGGYSRNRRSLLGSGKNWVFVKEVDTDLLPDEGQVELWWLKKDQLCTELLRQIAPELVPEWSRLEANGHALVMTSYRPADGWLWESPNDPELQTRYIQAVVDATRKLESVHLNEDAIGELELQPYLRDKLALDDGLLLILESPAIRNQLQTKYASMLEESDLKPQIEQMVALLSNESALQLLLDHGAQLIEQPNDSFGHCDVRSDNLAFHPEINQVKLVDWNWASYMPKSFGATEFLIDMTRRGVDVSPWAKDLNIELLAATVGYYAKRSLQDRLTPGSAMREMQAESAAAAYDMYLMVTSPSQLIIDVREPREFERGHAEGAINIPPASLMSGASELENVDKDTKIIIYCITGARSNTCMHILREMGFTNLINGINASQVTKKYL